ncbi:hypothetical protein [Paenibacillus campinasensis]|uniref:Uncharacterized protein n=1 Tax=Paenibacillus campinasensis TaxID=66347 RepID=A0A268EHK5_9BACL|nr:hypothetical protein [Paenibacillus campinasensis]PAD72613.1 hypothetical protein CHH67_21790 [Paenibacillus campinasensis]
MKLFLFISQSIYALMLVPWLIVWGVSFMVFDSGLSLWGVGIMIMVTLYPIAVAMLLIILDLCEEDASSFYRSDQSRSFHLDHGLCTHHLRILIPGELT